jgi:histidyl-tRNA synthetase
MELMAAKQRASWVVFPRIMAEVKKLSTDSYKGVRDFYPEDQVVQNYIFSTMRRVVESFGYVEYGASILEDTDIYRAKSGSEIVNEQTYSFTDRGGRDVTIRPEMTPTVARMVAKKRQELSFPLRWYSIPNLFRYERPQRGRLREHWQLNCDMFGVDSIQADAEIITVAYNIMKAFGAEDGDFVVRINNRLLLNAVLNDYLGLDAEKSYALTKLVDRKEKMPLEDFTEEAKKILGDKTDLLFKYLNAATPDDLPVELQETSGVQDLVKLISILQVRGVSGIKFDPTLVRGFDYYTGTVFEFFDVDPSNNRSLFGGGRYDDLVSLFDVDPVSAVGFGMGDVTIRDFLETHGLMPKLNSSTKVYICQLLEKTQVSSLKSQVLESAEDLASYLRQNGVNVAVDFTGRKVGAQIKTAEKQNIPYIICVGEEEASTKKFKLKNLEKHEEVEVEMEEMPKLLK